METSKHKDLLTYAVQKLNLFIQSKQHKPAKPVPARQSAQG